MSTDEVRERLQLDKFPGRRWHVQASCATSGEGLVEGLNWLAESIRLPVKITPPGGDNTSPVSSTGESLNSPPASPISQRSGTTSPQQSIGHQ